MSSLRHIWTAQERDLWIENATNSKVNRGHQFGYNFHVVPKVEHVDDDQRRSLMTQAIAELVYTKDPKYRCLSLGFYDILMSKMMTHPFISQYVWKDVVVILKGSNAYALLIPDRTDELSFSDLDIMVYINPYLSDDLFDLIAKNMRIIVLQTMSLYKKTLDHMFFLDIADPDIKYKWMDESTIENFKRDHIECMQRIGAISVFESKEVRNVCSRHSFMLVNNSMYSDKVVKIEVPHFEKCDRIPLRKTPFFTSYNNTINFGNDDHLRNIELFRIKCNNLILTPIDSVFVNFVYNENGQVKLLIEQKVQEERIPADFIDVTIASKGDCELLDFWNNGRFVNVLDVNTGVWLAIPDIKSCIKDLYKMLHVYDCPESKRSKRLRKYNLLLSYMT